MKVLIAGASGQVGTALSRATPAGMKVFAYDRSELDIADPDQVRARVCGVKPDVVLNAAAYTAVDRAESESTLANQVNAVAPQYLAEVCQAVNCRLIHFSSDYVFDGTSNRAYVPSDAPNPLNAYGRTKLAGEVAVRTVLPQASTVVRTSWVYGPRGQNFVQTILRVLSEKAEVRVVVDQIGTPTSTTSLAKVVWRMVERSTPAGTYHWTDAGVSSWYDFAVAIAEEGVALGLVPASAKVYPIRTEQYSTPAMRPRMSLLDSASTHTATGIQPRHWRVELREVLAEVHGA